jgi:hypothetical protein
MGKPERHTFPKLGAHPRHWGAHPIFWSSQLVETQSPNQLGTPPGIWDTPPTLDTLAGSCYNGDGWKDCFSSLDDSLPRN